MRYTDFYSTKVTPQSRPIPGEDMVKNNAGGYVYKADKLTRLLRFLILGVESGSYYVGKQELVIENATVVRDLAETHGREAVEMIVDVSVSGRAAKNDPALFALAICASAKNDMTRIYALAALPKVARTASHLMQFTSFVTHFRGWGRGLRTAVANWYLEKSKNSLAYQAVKYRSRNGWSHRDLLRVSHPSTENVAKNAIFKWIVSGEMSTALPGLIEDFEQLQLASEGEAVKLLENNKSLTWEMLPTTLLNSKRIWSALLVSMPMTAMIRNLPKMTSVGLFPPFSTNATHVQQLLANEDVLQKARIHPLKVLAALLGYQNGANRNLIWTPNLTIVSALEKAFYKTFRYVKPTYKNIILAIDVSGSMGMRNVSGILGMTPAMAAAAQALVLANTEPNHYIFGFNREFTRLPIRPEMSLKEVMQITYHSTFGGTDCSLPMRYAEKHELYNVDAFVILTDYETWTGLVHPSQALDSYEKAAKKSAKLISVGMVANAHTFNSYKAIAANNVLDVVGFDTNTPETINTFLKM